MARKVNAKRHNAKPSARRPRGSLNEQVANDEQCGPFTDPAIDENEDGSIEEEESAGTIET
jgi:hypothetical protein